MTPAQPVSNAVILERVENLIRGQAELIRQLGCHVDTQENFERVTLQYRERQSGTNDITRQRIDAHEKDIQELRAQVEKLAISIQPLIVANRILSILGGLALSSIVALVLGILFHQVTLVFP